MIGNVTNVVPTHLLQYCNMIKNTANTSLRYVTFCSSFFDHILSFFIIAKYYMHN